MIETVLGLIVRFGGLFGISSKFWAGVAIAGVVAAGFAAYSGYLVHRGYEWAEGKCEAAALRLKNEQLAATLAETQRQLAAASEIQKRDAQRAADAEQRLQANEAAVNETPVNSSKCFDRPATGRVRNVH